MNAKITILGVLVAAGCGAPSTPASQGGALSASPDAQAFGVGSYVVERDSVSILSTAGDLFATLTIEVPGADARTVHMISPDGRTSETEVTGKSLPLHAFVEPGQESTILADPALADFFGTRDLAFTVVGSGLEDLPAAAIEQLKHKLAPEIRFAYCEDITFTTGCNKWSQCPAQTNNITAHHNVSAGSQSACESNCGSYLGLWYWVQGFGYFCTCYSGTSYNYDLADCTPNGHGCSTRDVVKKHRTCDSSLGTCASQSDGFQYCL